MRAGVLGLKPSREDGDRSIGKKGLSPSPTPSRVPARHLIYSAAFRKSLELFRPPSETMIINTHTPAPNLPPPFEDLPECSAGLRIVIYTYRLA